MYKPRMYSLTGSNSYKTYTNRTAGTYWAEEGWRCKSPKSTEKLARPIAEPSDDQIQ